GGGRQRPAGDDADGPQHLPLPDRAGGEVLAAVGRIGAPPPFGVPGVSRMESMPLAAPEGHGTTLAIMTGLRRILLVDDDAGLRGQLRQHEASEDAAFTIGPYTFQPGSKMLIDRARSKKIRLTEKETSILRYLCRSGEHAVSRETLLGEVWGYNAGVNTHTL